MDPLIYGNYPFIMRTLVRERLPEFTIEQSMMLKESFDFIGMNYYSSNYAVDVPVANSIHVSYSTDSLANLTGKLKWIFKLFSVFWRDQLSGIPYDTVNLSNFI